MLKVKNKIKLLLAHAKLFITRRTKLRRVVLAILAPFPTLKRRLKQVAQANEARPTAVIHKFHELDCSKQKSVAALTESLISASAQWRHGKRIDGI